MDELTLDQQLCFALYGASMAIGRAYKPLLDALEITYPQYLVLSTLWEGGAQSVGDIAERLALESSTITPLVKRLEQADFVVRKRNPEDERQVVVSLTAKGTRLREKARCLGETLFAAAGMTPKRLIDLNREVRAFRDAVADFLEKTLRQVAETSDTTRAKRTSGAPRLFVRSRERRMHLVQFLFVDFLCERAAS